MVGESGSGKSVTAYSVLRLIPYPGRIIDGSIRFDGEDLLSMSPAEMRKIRGNRISMIFQEPMTSLNPVLTVGRQIMEPLIFHQGMARSRAWEESIRLLGLVGIPSAEHRIHEYPHQLSGGMRQRVMIAMALACRPGPAHRRRTDHCSGRDHPGPDPGSHEAAPEGVRHGHHADHPQPGCGGADGRPGGGDVCRAGGGVWGGGPDIRRPRHPYTVGFWDPSRN